MRTIYGALGLIALGACSPKIPDSAAGVGFDNSQSVQQAREAQLSGQAIAPPLAVSSEPLASLPPATTASVAQPAPGSVDIAAGAAAAIAASEGAVPNPVEDPLPTSAPDPAPKPLPADVQASNPRISDENDFGAVSSRETIESDAARIARNKEQYTTVAPTAVPKRDGSGGPNIVQYALSTSNPVGNRIYSRSGINLAGKAQRNCATFASPDQAQIAFLDAGGPKKDRRGLDPDGDGYACSWNPAPFRKAVSN